MIELEIRSVKTTRKVKIDSGDYPKISSYKYKIRKLDGELHPCRIARTGKGNKYVLLAQDIINSPTKVYFIDKNTFNCQKENLRPMDRNNIYFYTESK